MCLMRTLPYHRHTLRLLTAIKDKRVSKEKGKANYYDAQPQQYFFFCFCEDYHR
jgi:hypothetical protein